MSASKEVFIVMAGNGNPFEYVMKVFATEDSAREYENYLNKILEKDWKDLDTLSGEVSIRCNVDYCYIQRFEVF